MTGRPFVCDTSDRVPTTEGLMEAIKHELLDSTAPFTKPAAKTKGKSTLEAEIERENQGSNPKALPKPPPMPRDVRADKAGHDYPSRHGDRGEDHDQSERRPKRFLRKRHVAARYGGVNERTVPRMVADDRLPPPDIYVGRFPMWAEDTLDAHDRKAVLARRDAGATANP
jgi:hypothetical protein